MSRRRSLALFPPPSAPRRKGRDGRVALPGLVLCAALLLPSAVSPARGDTPPDPARPDPQWLTLKNGARVLLAPDPQAAAVSVAVWIESGVRYERPGILGISHLAEHVSARGIDPRGEAEVRRKIEAEGGATAAFTSADFTCFTHSVPREALERVVQLEAGRFSARPTQAMLDEDRAVTQEEIRVRARMNPLERPLQELYAVAFPDHPYRWPVLGADEDLARISLADCQTFLRSRYVPDQAVITVVGDFDPAEALSFLRRHIEPLRGRGWRPPGTRPQAQPTDERRMAAVGDLPVPVLVVGWRTATGADEDAVALEAISTLLASGPAGRLGQRLVGGEQSCLFARAGRDRQRDATVLWVGVALKPGADSAAVEHALLEEVGRFASEPISGEVLDQVRRQIEVAMLLGRQSASDRGQALGTAQLVDGDWREAGRDLERLRTLTPADIQGAATRLFTEARRTVVWLAPAVGGGSGGGRP